MATRVAILDPARLEREILGLPERKPRVWDSYMTERRAWSSPPPPCSKAFLTGLMAAQALPS